MSQVLPLGKGWGSCTGWDMPWPLAGRSSRREDSTKDHRHPRVTWKSQHLPHTPNDLWWVSRACHECWGCFCSQGQQWHEEMPAQRHCSSTQGFTSGTKLLAERTVRSHLLSCQTSTFLGRACDKSGGIVVQDLCSAIPATGWEQSGFGRLWGDEQMDPAAEHKISVFPGHETEYLVCKCLYFIC